MNIPNDYIQRALQEYMVAEDNGADSQGIDGRGLALCTILGLSKSGLDRITHAVRRRGTSVEHYGYAAYNELKKSLRRE